MLVWVQGRNVLRKEPMSKDVEETDTFSFNEAFTSKFFKVKIGTISAQKESEPEKQETRIKVRWRMIPSVYLVHLLPWHAQEACRLHVVLAWTARPLRTTAAVSRGVPKIWHA